MKNLLAILLYFFVGYSFSATTPNVVENEPILKLAVYDMSAKIPKDIGLVYSRSNKNLQLCWTAFNIQLSQQNSVEQVFTSPNNKAKFDSPNAKVTLSNNGRTSKITSVDVKNDAKVVEQCWKFNEQDPIGKYQLAVKINDISFSALEFEITK